MTFMRRFAILSLLMVLMSALGLHASGDRDKWFKELRQYKKEFIIKELELSKEQQTKFFPVYYEMTRKIMKLNDDTRALEKKIDTNKGAVSDIEYEKAAEALLELKAKEAKIEAEYYPKFKQILTPKQMYKLPKAEKKFTRQLMKHHNKAKTVKKAPKTAFTLCDDCNA